MRNKAMRRLTAGLATAALATFAAGCGGGGGGGGSDPDVGANALYVVDVDVDGLDNVPLNQAFTIEFSEWVNPASIRHDTVQVRVGPRYGIQSFGDFKVSGNLVTFFPQLPTKADLSDSGFQPQSDYRVTVIGHPRANRVNSFNGRPLRRTFTANFATAATTSPDLFTTDAYKDTPPPSVTFTNPPDVLPGSPWTAPGGATDVPTDAEISMVFNRVPLDPATINTNNVSLRMVERLGVTQNRPIQGTPVVEQSFEGTRLLFVPTFPLADQARYALRIENRVTDLTGTFDVADNAARAALRTQAESGLDPALTQFALDHPEEVDPRTFLIFTTRDEPTKDLTLINNFDDSDVDQDGNPGVDTDRTTASYNDSVPGAVAAVFTAAGGNGTLGEFTPSSNTTLNTNSSSAVNGAFNFSKIEIKTGVTVTVEGDLPATLLSISDLRIEGTLRAFGGDGEQGENTYTSSALPLYEGGDGVLGGGDGGDSYTGSSWASSRGGNGGDGSNSGGKGGQGGQAAGSSATIYSFGGGGGGGGHQFAGDKGGDGGYPSYSSWNGKGGNGGASGGIIPTSANTADGKDFATEGVAGGGGGAGANSHYYPNGTNWRQGAAGGGGAGGGLLLKGAKDIIVSGSILATGGNGGQGGNASSYGGAAGGGGAGGTIALYANGNLDISGASLDTSGGNGGSSTGNGWNGRGGKGGAGYIVLEDADGSYTSNGSTNLIPDPFTGTFDPTGTLNDAPSVFTSGWFAMGVFDPIIQSWTPQDFTEQLFPGTTITYEIQMAIENAQDFGRADTTSINASTGVSGDLAKASQWQKFKDPNTGIDNSVLTALNGKGYQFYRLRMTFTLKDGQKRNDPVPYVDQLKIRVKY